MKTERTRDDYGRGARRLAAVWVALLALLMLSFGSAYLRLGAFNLVVSLVIAAIKIGLIAVFFMHLPRAGAWSRLAAWAAAVLLMVLGTLSTFENVTRTRGEAAWQLPASVPAMLPPPPAAGRSR
ncbi:MAG: cytochrome C oxidase subunit IV family protein [Variovorax sp.]|nr:cytochrome C oxidase subunit IV family protein [Variovorax sp.]